MTIVDCNGRIVFGEESALLRDTVKKLIGENNQIILNLGGISYIDSGGLGTLVALYTTAHNAGGAVKLANLTQRVGDLLQVTKLLTVFEVYDSEEKAIAVIRKRRGRVVSDNPEMSSRAQPQPRARAARPVEGPCVCLLLPAIHARQHDR